MLLKKIIIMYLILVITFIFGCAQKTPKTFEFHGDEIFDTKSQVLIRPSENRDVIFIQNAFYRYMMVLPYSEDWNIGSNKYKPLLALDKQSGDYVSLQIVQNPKLTHMEYFEHLLDSFKDNEDVVIEKPDFIKSSDSLILKYRSTKKEINGKFESAGSWNYWIIYPDSSKWHIIHWSKSDTHFNDSGAMNEKIIIKSLSRYKAFFRYKSPR